MHIKPYAFVPWGATGLPERFQGAPAGSAAPAIPGGKPGAPAGQPTIEDRADWQMRPGSGGDIVLASAQDLFVLGPGEPARLRRVDLPADNADSRVVDFRYFGGELVLLQVAGERYRVRRFGLDGAPAGEIALETGAEVGSYQQLLGSEEALFVVGNQAATATFLRAPSLFELSADAAPKLVHRWSDARIQRLFMDARGRVFYSKEIDRKYYWTMFEPGTGRERVSEQVDQTASPFLRLPLGVDDAGNGYGRAGMKVGRFDADNELLGAVAMDNLFRHDGKVYRSRLDDTKVIVTVTGASGAAEDIELPIPAETAERFPFKNWTLIGVGRDGNFLVQGFGPRTPGRLLVRFAPDGAYVAEGMAERQLLLELGHRTQPPATWLVQPDGTLLVPCSGPDGLTVFALTPGA
ncbi:hypothetical protein [Haliangium sp.]|uniref:hypothetical protein n=1 Tax=Haliangium sp. TaxID=2663208 RepID=UPI003D09BC79